MTLIARLSRLVHADIHAVLDNLEEPSSLLKQSIREMELAISQSQQSVEQTRNQIEKNKRELIQLNERIAGFDEEIDTCFNADDEQLIKAILRRKLEAAKFQEYVNIQLEQSLARYERQSTWLTESMEQLDSLRRRAELLDQERTSTDSEGNPGTSKPYAETHQWAVSSDDVEIAYLKEKAQRQLTGD